MIGFSFKNGFICPMELPWFSNFLNGSVSEQLSVQRFENIRSDFFEGN
jgi:hypothetical protein